MVDPKEHLGATQMVYVNPAPAASSLPAATPNTLLNRMGDLERALRLVQGGERQSFEYRDLCYFPEAVLPLKFRIPNFDKYNGKGCPISHLRAYCGNPTQL